jgi:hypothetical protein
MMRSALVSAAVAGVLAAVLGAGLARPASTVRVSSESQARAVASQFFGTINAKRWEVACKMMSARFYKENHVPSEARCVLGFRIGLMNADAVRFAIVGVRIDGDRAVVQATADGAPGRIVLIQEHGVFKVLSLRGT